MEKMVLDSKEHEKSYVHSRTKTIMRLVNGSRK